MSIKKPENQKSYAVISLFMGMLILSAFISLDVHKQINLLGRFGHGLASLMVDELLGFSAFFIPGFLIYVGLLGLKGRNRYYFINHGLNYLLCFLSLFTLNVYLLNYSQVINSAYSGLFPKLLHNIVLHYFGVKGKLEASFGSHLLELFLLILSLFPFLRHLPLEKLSVVTALLGSVVDSAKKRLNNISNMKNLSNLMNKSKLLIEAGQKKEKLIRRVHPTDFPEIQGDPLFMRLNGKEENTTLPVQAEAILDEEDQKSMKQEAHVDLKIHSADSDVREGKVNEEREELKILSSKETLQEDGTVDIDLSTLSASPHFQKPTEHSENHPEENQPKEPLVVIDPEKTPAVLNQKKANYFKENLSDILGDASLLQYSELTIKDPSFEASIRATAEKLERTIQEFGIQTKVVSVSTGPVITRYELTLEPGVKIARVVNLADNIALSLAAPSVRIVAPIPGKGVIGIEIPNERRQMVRLRDIIENDSFANTKQALPIALGKSILGESVVKDIATTPHLLIAGATGSGKSVCVNSIITSLLIKRTPQEVRFLMIDPKMVELNVYNHVPHLLCPVITDAKKAALALRWVIAEMESRYYLLEKYAARSIKSYNSIIEKKLTQHEALEEGIGSLPYIVVIIDEFADLMMVARKEVEDSVTRLAAMSRAVGIHLILATQRPSVDVITGIIKANFPSRIAFQVSSKVDSRTILDTGGADQLLGKGDMLYTDTTSPIPERIQGAFLSDEEVSDLVRDLKKYGEPEYLEDIFAIGENTDKNALNEVQDNLFDEAVHIVISDKKASASYLQRRLKIGYNRAARIVEMMDEMGIVGPADGSRPREVLINHWHGVQNHAS